MIVYTKDLKLKSTILKISHDFNTVVFSNGQETYRFGVEEESNRYIQKKISWLGEKKMAFILGANREFMFVSHKEYDTNIDIQSSA